MLRKCVLNEFLPIKDQYTRKTGCDIVCMQSNTGLTMNERRLSTMKSNTNNTSKAMAQAIDFGAIAGMMQAMQALAPMMQAMQAQQAQAQQAQAMGAGDAGKALPLQGKAQGKAQAHGIQWQAIQRQNERQTVYDVRQAMVKGESFEGLVKAWIVLNEKKVPADERVRKVCDDMRCACLHAKDMSVKAKDGKTAHFEVASMVTVKRAFYCAMRGMSIVETRQDVRPATRGNKAQGK